MTLIKQQINQIQSKIEETQKRNQRIGSKWFIKEDDHKKPPFTGELGRRLLKKKRETHRLVGMEKLYAARGWRPKQVIMIRCVYYAFMIKKCRARCIGTFSLHLETRGMKVEREKSE